MNKTLVCMLAALAIPAGAAQAADYPEMKEGLWQIHNQFLDAQGKVTNDGTSEVCRNHAYDKAVQDRARAMMAKTCSPPDENYSGNKFTSEISCKMMGSTVDTKSVATFQGDSAAHSESHTTYNPPLSGSSGEAMTQDQKYLGSCPAGMQPGDRKNADGSISHSSALRP